MDLIFYFNLFSIPVIVALILSLLLFYLSFYKESNQGELYFSIFCLCSGIYIFFYILELSTASLVYINLFLKLQYLGASFITAFLLIFAIKFSQNDRFLNKLIFGLIFTIPFITLCMALTNDIHHLFYKNVAIEYNGYFFVSKTEKGPFYQLHQIYSVLSSLIADIFIFSYLISVPRAYFKKVLIVFIGIITSWLAYIFYITGNVPYGVDSLPFAFTLSAFIIYFGLMKFDLFGTIPIAYKTLFNNIKDAVIVSDSENRIVEINNSARLLFKKSINKVFYDVSLFFEDWQEIVDIYNQDEANILIQKTINGNLNWFELSLKSNFNQKNVYLGKVLTVRDITNLKKNEIERDNALELLRETNDLAKVGGWVYYVISEKIVWTQQTKKIHEVDSDYIPSLDTALSFYKEGESREMISELLNRAILNMDSFDTELELITAKGKPIWVRVFGRPEFRNNKCYRLYGAIMDITDKKAIENSLKKAKINAEEQALFYKSLMNNQAVFICKTDREGTFTFINEIFSQEFSKGESLIGKNYKETTIKQDWKLIDNVLEKCIQNPNIGVQVILKKSNKDNIIKGSTWEFKAVKDKNGEIAEILCVGYDITELLEKQTKLQELVDLTAEQNNRLTNFTHIVSHNIRSHISNMIGLLELIEIDEEEKKQEYFGFLKVTVNNLEETIQNLNEIVSIQTNVKLPKSEIEIKNQIDKIIGSIKSIAEQKGVKIINNSDSQLILRSNLSYFESIVLNLITNGIKYSDTKKESYIEIRTRADEQYIYLIVEDNGLGMDMNRVKDKLFGMYKTFHGNSDAKGMGLFITKTQIEVLKGKIDVESELGKGTTFTVCFKK